MPRQVKCPRCSTINTVADGAKPICVNCGFGSPGAAPARAPAQAGFQGAAAAPAYPGQNYGPVKRPGMVTAVSVIGFIFAAIYILAGLLFVIFGSAFSAAFSQAGVPDLADLGTAIFVAIGVVALLIGGLQLLIAMHIMKGKNWARITQTVLSVLFGLSALSNFPNGLFQVALNVFIVVALFLPASSAFFAARKAKPAAYGQPMQ